MSPHYINMKYDKEPSLHLCMLSDLPIQESIENFIFHKHFWELPQSIHTKTSKMVAFLLQFLEQINLQI